MSRRIKPKHSAGRELEEVREKDPDGRIVVHHRTVDTLGKMLRAGTIDHAMDDAAKDFQAAFILAQLDPHACGANLSCHSAALPLLGAPRYRPNSHNTTLSTRLISREVPNGRYRRKFSRSITMSPGSRPSPTFCSNGQSNPAATRTRPTMIRKRAVSLSFS